MPKLVHWIISDTRVDPTSSMHYHVPTIYGPWRTRTAALDFARGYFRVFDTDMWYQDFLADNQTMTFTYTEREEYATLGQTVTHKHVVALHSIGE